MATSGSKSVTVTSWDTLKFSWWENSQSIANNTTTIGWKMELISGSSGRIDSSTSKTWTVTVNGTKYSGTNTVGIANNDTKTLATGTTTISHNSNGTKTFSYSFSQSFSGITFSGTSRGTKSGSGSGTLDTIPRASSLTASNGTLGTEQTLTINRADNSFTHTITYKCGSASGTIATKTSGTSVSFTPAISLASQNTVGTSVSVVFTLTTYSGSTNIGTATKTISCTIPESVKPSCLLTVTDPTGYSDTYGNPVKGLSKFKIVVTPSLAYDSPIALYSTTVNGTKYTAASFTTGVLNSAGSQTISATVNDKRGRSGSASASKTVLDYTQPVIIKLVVKRCNENGAANDQGEYVQVTLSATVTALNNKNTAQYTLQYKKSTETAYTSVTLDEISNVYSVTDKTYIFPADSGSSYDVLLSVSDNHGTTKRTTSASTGFTLMHFKADGTGIGIGKISEESNLLDVGLKTKFNKPVFGNVMGLSYLPDVSANSNMNDYLTTGSYAVKSNADAETIKNIPVNIAGRLEVANSTVKETPATNWAYLRQKYIPYLTDYPTYERNITRNESNVWTYSDWTPTSLREQKILWSGVKYMTGDHKIELNELVSQQPCGIELVFSRASDGAAENSNFIHFFVSKKFVETHAGAGSAFFMSAVNFSFICSKYLYISNGHITGNDLNNATGTNNGVTYNNAGYVLRYVIGV